MLRDGAQAQTALLPRLGAFLLMVVLSSFLLLRKALMSTLLVVVMHGRIGRVGQLVC